LSLSPATLTATAGSSNSSFAVSISSLNGFSGAVSVALSGLPTGVTTSPTSPFTLAAGSSQTVTLSIPTTAPAGSYTVTASGTSGALTHTAPLSLTINPAPDFSISISPATLTATAGSSNSSFAVSITGQNGFSGSVTVTLSGLPAGVTTSPSSPFTVAAGSSQTVAVSVTSTTLAGDFNVMASGTSGSLTHSEQLLLTILGQIQVTTWRYNNARSGANTWETVLTPSNVNS